MKAKNMTPMLYPFTLLLLACTAGCGDYGQGTTGKPVSDDAVVSTPAPAPAAPAPGSMQSPEQNIALLKSRLFDDPDNVDLLSALGDAYFEAGQFPRAIEIYDRAIELDPSNADCMNDRGLAYFYTGNTDAALASVNAAIEAVPSYVHSWLTKGFILRSLGRHDEAVEAFTRVKDLDVFGQLGKEADRYLQEIESERERG